MRKVIYTVGCSLVILGLLIQAIELVAFDRNLYEKQYHELQTYEYIGISEEELMNATNVLLLYMEGKSPNMNVEAMINGRKQEVFNQKEKDHMLDVNALIEKGIWFKWLSFLLYGVICLYAFLDKRHKGLKELGNALLIGLLIDFILCGIVVAYATIDFESFWTTFHQLFFNNDLWLLNPATDIMIMMFPLEFFKNMVIRIITYYVGLLALVMTTGLFLGRDSIKKT